MNKTISNIIETIKELDWKLIQIWVEDNCIYAYRVKGNGEVVQEGLYAGSEFDPNDVYNIFYELRRVLDFQRILVNDDLF